MDDHKWYPPGAEVPVETAAALAIAVGLVASLLLLLGAAALLWRALGLW